VLPNIFKDNKVSILERESCSLRLSFAVCGISEVLLISACKRRFGVDFGLYSVG